MPSLSTFRQIALARDTWHFLLGPMIWGLLSGAAAGGSILLGRLLNLDTLTVVALIVALVTWISVWRLSYQLRRIQHHADELQSTQILVGQIISTVPPLRVLIERPEEELELEVEDAPTG